VILRFLGGAIRRNAGCIWGLKLDRFKETINRETDAPPFRGGESQAEGGCHRRAGFIAGHLVDCLIEDRWEIRVIDILSSC